MVSLALDCLIPLNQFMSLTLGYENTLAVAEQVERRRGPFIEFERLAISWSNRLPKHYLIFLYKLSFDNT